MPSVLKLLGSAVLAGAVSVAVVGCGSDDQTTAASPSAAVTSPQASTVAGRKPVPPPSSIPASKKTAEVAGTTCGLTKGPDGALTIVILEGNTSCDTVQKVAQEFAPKMATGTNQSVSGWDCGPAQTTGVLFKCTKGDDAFGLVAK